jgi:uncharacterized membrane protein (TIGR01666 family)
MDYVKEYRSFISSHYINEGVRVSAGILIPALVLGHFGEIQTGIAVALGALAVSIADNPGPIHHRRNGMIVSGAIAFFIALVSGYTSSVDWLFFLLLPAFCFFFSMIGIYGTRATAIGIAALLVLVIQTQQHFHGTQILINALHLLAGSTWYILFSLGLYTIRPYKLIQQAMGEYVIAAGFYLRAKARFYIETIDTEDSFRDLFETQRSVQEKQNLVAELLFRTRSIVRESTNTSRTLMMAFLDVSDLFERAMTAHQDYRKLHKYFNNTGIMAEYRLLILALADELDEIGIALNSGRRSKYTRSLDDRLLMQRQRLEHMRQQYLTPLNLEGFISLRHILDSIDDIAARIRILHQYTSYDKKLKRKDEAPDPEQFVTHQHINPKMFVDNLTFRSNIFRHSIRIALAALAGYTVGWFFPLGHSYWILLTVIVILKPAYSLTKQRNVERLAGTVIGAALGATLLFFIQDNTAILILMTITMAGAYSFLRKQYFVSMILMTLYLLLMFHLLYPNDFTAILKERIIDTAIGSALAFIFSFLLSPIWEHEQIDNFLKRVLHDNMAWYEAVALAFTGQAINSGSADLKRKESWVSLANLSDAFNRMLSEPKSKQRNIRHIHQFLVSNHMLASHIATLSYYAENLQPENISADYHPVIRASLLSLQRAARTIEGESPDAIDAGADAGQVGLLDKRVNALMLKRQKELEEGQLETSTRSRLSVFKSITDQFYFIYKTAIDIDKIATRLKFPSVEPQSAVLDAELAGAGNSNKL